MARIVTIIAPPDKCEIIIDYVNKLKGAGSIQLQKDGAVKPPGDIITISTTNGAAIELDHWLKENGVGEEEGSSISISEPTNISSHHLSPLIKSERNEGTPGETQNFLHKPTATDMDTYLIMFGAGVFAAVGIITDAIHLALAGFILAPGFQPIMMITFGLLKNNSEWKRGVKQTFLMFLALLAGAIVASLAMQWAGYSLIGGKAPYLPEGGTLIDYWAQLNFTVYFIAAIAGFVGTSVVSSRQPSLIPSITIAVALIPSMSIVGIGLIAGEFDFMFIALSRWAVEVGILLIFSFLSFWLQLKFKKNYINI